MNEERTMILKMLKEGKISMEEAEALLEVLQESEKEEEAEKEQESGPRVYRETHDEKKDYREEQKEEGFGGFGKSFSDGFKDFGRSMEELLRGVEKTVKESMKGIKNINIGEYLDSSLWKSKVTDDKNIQLTSEGMQELSINNSWGDCKIAGKSGGDIIITASVTAWGPNQEEAQQKIDSIEIEPVIHLGKINLNITKNHGESGRAGINVGRHPRVDLSVEIPGNMTITSKNKSGNISVSGIEGGIVLESYSGDLRISGCSRGIKGKTKSGDIEGDMIQGDAVLETLSGDVEISNFNGTLSAASKSGDVEVEEFEGEMQIISASGDCSARISGSTSMEGKTISGDISVTIPPGCNPSQVNLKDTSGDIAVRAADDFSGKVEMRTKSGSVRSKVTLESEEREGKYLRGVLNSGDGSLNCQTVSGDVTLLPL